MGREAEKEKEEEVAEEEEDWKDGKKMRKETVERRGIGIKRCREIR